MYMFHPSAKWVIVISILLQLFGPTQDWFVTCLRILYISIWAERSSSTIPELLDLSQVFQEFMCEDAYFFSYAGAYRLEMFRMDASRDYTVWQATMHIKVEFLVYKSMPQRSF